MPVRIIIFETIYTIQKTSLIFYWYNQKMQEETKYLKYQV